MQKFARSTTLIRVALALSFAGCAAPPSPVGMVATATPAPEPAVNAATPTAPAPVAAPDAPHATAPKMAAPITLAIAQRATGATSYELTLTATLTADVDDLQLRLDKKIQAFGARRKGDVLSLITTVELSVGDGMDAIGGATLMRGSRKLTAAIAERVGTPAKQPASTVVEVPGIGQVSGAKQ